MCKNFGCGVQGAETIIATIYNLSVTKLCDVCRFSFMMSCGLEEPPGQQMLSDITATCTSFLRAVEAEGLLL